MIQSRGKVMPSKASKNVNQSIIMVAQSRTISYDDLMKLPKAQLIKEMLTIPENRTRFILDVDEQTQQGKDLVAVMNRLQSGDPNATRAVSEILASLACLVTGAPVD
jgi:hypothetical protein